VELSANPRYWRGKVPIQKISIKFIADPTNQALAFRAGDIDIANNLADPRGFVAASGAASAVKTYPSCGVLHMSMNTKVGPWANIHVRRAAAYATNRADIIKAGGGPLVGSPAFTLIDPSLLRPLVPKAQADKFFKSLNTYPFNLAKAQAELRQSPYPNGFSSTLSSLPFGLFPQIMQAFAGDLAKIGIKIDVKVKTIGEWFAETTGDKNKVPLFFDGTECNSPFPGTTPDSFVYGKNVAEGKFNTANYTNPRVDALLDAGKTVTNRAKSFAIYSQILTILSQDVPYIPLYVANESYAFSPKFTYPQKSLYDVGMVDRNFMLGVKPK
jgi:peptide/nickel transport system substrate-binding protein